MTEPDWKARALKAESSLQAALGELSEARELIEAMSPSDVHTDTGPERGNQHEPGCVGCWAEAFLSRATPSSARARYIVAALKLAECHFRLENLLSSDDQWLPAKEAWRESFVAFRSAKEALAAEEGK